MAEASVPDIPSGTPCPMCGASPPDHLAARTYNGKTYHLAVCRQCGQHYCDPPPTSNEIRSFYEGDYHQELRTIGSTEAVFGEKFVRYRDWILKFVKPGRSVDIGTATGMLPALLKQVGFQAEGVEYNRSSAEWGVAHFGVAIRIGGAELVAQEVAAFDLITMTDVLEHTEHPLRTLEAMHRSLKPGGFMLITFPDVQSVQSRYERLLVKITRREWLWSCCHIPLHTWEFTTATARRMLQRASFDVVGFRRSQVAPDRLTGLPGLLTAPVQALTLKPLAETIGTQMEFMIRKLG